VESLYAYVPLRDLTQVRRKSGKLTDFSSNTSESLSRNFEGYNGKGLIVVSPEEND
jgi:hypothetical protein